MDAIDQLDNLNKLINTVVEELAIRTVEKSILLENKSECIQPMNGHEDLLYILLRNLIDNTIRYTPPSSRIILICKESVRSQSFSVMDQGPGIAAGKPPRVFDRFYRDIENTSNESGLMFAIAALHGAKISLDTGKNNRGLLATVTFRR